MINTPDRQFDKMSNRGGRQLGLLLQTRPDCGWQVIPPPDATVNHGAAATFLTARLCPSCIFFAQLSRRGSRSLKRVIKEVKEAGEKKLSPQSPLYSGRCVRPLGLGAEL